MHLLDGGECRAAARLVRERGAEFASVQAPLCGEANGDQSVAYALLHKKPRSEAGLIDSYCNGRVRRYRTGWAKAYVFIYISYFAISPLKLVCFKTDVAAK